MKKFTNFTDISCTSPSLLLFTPTWSYTALLLALYYFATSLHHWSQSAAPSDLLLLCTIHSALSWHEAKLLPTDWNLHKLFACLYGNFFIQAITSQCVWGRADTTLNLFSVSQADRYDKISYMIKRKSCRFLFPKNSWVDVMQVKVIFFSIRRPHSCTTVC